MGSDPSRAPDESRADRASGVTVGVIGTGRMGGTILRAAARYRPDIQLLVAGRNHAACADLARAIPGLRVAEPAELARAADLLILALPPDAYLPILARLAPDLGSSTIVVSLANGVALEALGHHVPNPIVKVIPTMAHSVGRGIALVIAGPRAGTVEVETVSRFFAAFSRPAVIDDRDSRVASNVSGSALALIAAFSEAFVAANAARAVTLDKRALTAMIAETLGAVSDLVRNGHDLSDIVHRTATPGGTTEAALKVLAAALPAADMVEATFRRQAAMQAETSGETGR